MQIGIGLSLTNINRAGAAAPAVSAVRQIASAVRVPGFNSASNLSNGTDTTANHVSAHWNESGQTLTEIATINVGWMLDNSSEIDLTDDFTITQTITYPFNTTVVAVLTWDGGSTSKTIAAGTQVVQSDWITLGASIPADAKFGCHTYITVASGKKYPMCGVGSTSLGDRKETGVGLTDKTQTLTVASALSGAVYRPSAILSRGIGLKNSIAGVGDSIMAGATDAFFGTRGGTGLFGRAAEGVVPFLHTGYSGTQAFLNAVSGKLNRRAALFAAAGITHVICEWGVNDLGARTPTQINGNLQTIWNTFAGTTNCNGEVLKVVQTTITPVSTSPVDKWRTLSGQTAAATTAGSGSNRALVNANTRTKPAPLYQVIELGDALEPTRDDGRWATGAAFSTHYKDAINATVQSGATTTSIPTDLGGTFNQWQNGAVLFTSGVLSGAAIAGVSSSSGGTLTIAAQASAPSAGDTLIMFPSGAQVTSDGLHPSAINVAAPGYGAVFVGRDAVIPYFQSYA